MRHHFTAIRLAFIVTVFSATSIAQTPLGTAFTYQGQLKSSGNPVNATADLQFTLFDDPAAGNQVGSTVQVNSVAVSNGLFTTPLDFGAAAFDGNARWMRIAVRSPAGVGSFTPLNPRQPLTAAPYALQTRGLYVDASENVGIGTTTPGDKLSVLGGALSFANPSDPVPYVGMDYDQASDALRVRSNIGDASLNTTLATFTRFGSVGIGTTSPAATLDVIGNTALPHLRIAARDDNSTPYGSFLSLDATPTTGGKDWIIYSTGAQAGEGLGELVFRNLTDGTPPVAFDANGQVGIGTTTPGDRLSIQGGALSFANPSNPIPYVGVDYDQASDALRVRTNVGGGGLNTTAMTVQRGSGNVGLGTSQPGARLDLSSDAQSAERLRLSGQEFYQSGVSASDGVSFLLGVNRNANRQLWIADSGRLARNSSNPTIRVMPGAGIDAIATDGVTSLDMTLQGNAGKLGIGNPFPTNKLSVSGNADFSGNVGIGTSNPHVALDVKGQVYVDPASVGGTPNISLGIGGTSTGLNAAGSGNLDIYSNNNRAISIRNGNVGIGTTSPSSALSVNGSMNATGSISSGGTVSCKTLQGVNTGTWAVYGDATNYSAIGGFSETANQDAIYGQALATTGDAAGVIGVEGAPSGWGLYASGDSGASGAKLFHIDHPQDPTHKYLNHFSSEGPEPYNVYSGSVVTDEAGVGWVELPGYFGTLNRDYRYQLTVADESDSDTFVQARVWRKIEQNRFAIRTSAPGVEVYWQVTGVRNDPGARRSIAAKPVEQAKVGDAIGKYIEPELYGQPAELAEHAAMRQRAPQSPADARLQPAQPAAQDANGAPPVDAPLPVEPAEEPATDDQTPQRL